MGRARWMLHVVLVALLSVAGTHEAAAQYQSTNDATAQESPTGENASLPSLSPEQQGVGGITVDPPTATDGPEIAPRTSVDPLTDGNWIDIFGHLPIQVEGRTKPIDTWAKNVAVQFTGRRYWGAERGPEAFAGRHRVELLADLLFQPLVLRDAELIEVGNKPFKRQVGLNEHRRFFSPLELLQNQGINAILNNFLQLRESNSEARPDKMQRIAVDIRQKLLLYDSFVVGEPIAIVPPPKHADGSMLTEAEMHEFRSVSANAMRVSQTQMTDPDVAAVQTALNQFKQAYLANSSLDSAATHLAETVYDAGWIDENIARDVRLEVFYNNHRPWLMTAVAYTLGIASLALSFILLPRLFGVLGVLFAVWGVCEQILGLYLRIEILGRAPVSNTYEALLWMGLVALGFGTVAHFVAKGRGIYFLSGLIAAQLSVLFAMLVPLEDQTNAIPAVLRSNYWLIIHVLTIVASYAVLGVAAVLGHIYLFKEVLFNRSGKPAPKLGNPLITQMYRSIQVGLVLLTVGTILGGVWAADSWGRFWGWDPKETWALISILGYLALIHARFVGWVHDFGFAVGSVIGIGLIGWTFYGVNYVMAAGLHSYGFGSGGEFWYFVWVGASIVFLVACRFRLLSLENRAARKAEVNARFAAPTTGTE
ncbi:MAG: cytochrome c biogenesis protein [Planctomycetota bacterium]